MMPLTTFPYCRLLTFSGGGEAEGDLCAAQDANRTAHRLHHAPERCVVDTPEPVLRIRIRDPSLFLTPGSGIQDG